MVLAQRQRSGSREENGEPTYKSKRLEAHTEGKTASQKERQHREKKDSIPKRMTASRKDGAGKTHHRHVEEQIWPLPFQLLLKHRVSHNPWVYFSLNC